MVDENTLRRLMALEAHRMNDGVVLDGVPLRTLLHQERSTARTKDGSEHRFDPHEVAGFAAVLSPLVRAGILLPVRFVLDHRVDGSACVSDPIFREALQQHDVHTGPVTNGRAWMSLPRALAFARRYPSLVQFLRL